MTTPELLALAHGTQCQGEHRCFYCGAAADESAPASVHVKPTFNDHALVARPGSAWVCVGCVLCLREAGTVEYHDGSSKTMTKAVNRMHSWIITEEKAVAANRAHLAWLRGTCLRPPAPPYSIVLADSGQKQLLYRGVVCQDESVASVCLEGDRIDYALDGLRGRLSLCGRIAAACGKMCLDAPLSARLWGNLEERYAEYESIINEWGAVYAEGLSRLAAWLLPDRKECEREYPSTVASGQPG